MNRKYKDTQLFREGDYSLTGATTGKLMQVTKTNKTKSEVTQWKYHTETRHKKHEGWKLKRENLKTKLKRVLIEEILLHENNA